MESYDFGQWAIFSAAVLGLFWFVDWARKLPKKPPSADDDWLDRRW